MITFKEFIQENKKPETRDELKSRLEKEDRQAKLSTQKPATMNNWDVVPDVHSKSAAYERHPKKTKRDWENLYDRITKHLEHEHDTKGMDSHVGIYFSKKLNHGIVAHVDAHNKVVKIKTTLPVGQHLATHPDDRHVMVECVNLPDYPHVFNDTIFVE